MPRERLGDLVLIKLYMALVGSTSYGEREMNVRPGNLCALGNRPAGKMQSTRALSLAASIFLSFAYALKTLIRDKKAIVYILNVPFSFANSKMCHSRISPILNLNLEVEKLFHFSQFYN
jgi:hypothetical protein